MNIIRELRRKNNLSQEELGEAIGIGQRTISKWESGKAEPAAFYYSKMALVFGVSVDYLLGLEDDSGNKTYNSVSYAATAEELKILKAYRKLPPDSCEMILKMLDIK